MTADTPIRRTIIIRMNRADGRTIFWIKTVGDAFFSPCMLPITIRINAANGTAPANTFKMGEKAGFENILIAT